MTADQFKHWFEGYVEHISGCPTDAQWRRIKGRVMELNRTSIYDSAWTQDAIPMGVTIAEGAR